MQAVDLDQQLGGSALMPFQALTEKQPAGSRVLLFGPPNSLKTTCLLQLPQPNHIISVPGEKGYDTIPADNPGIKPYIWRTEDASKLSPFKVVAEMEEIVTQIRAGKFGEARSICLDGVHKAYDWFYAKALMGLMVAAENRAKGQPVDEEQFRGPAYGVAHNEFGLWLTRLLQSKTEYVWITTWEADKKDDPKLRDPKAPTHVYPDLPGQLGKRIVGEVSAVLYCKTELDLVSGRLKGKWLLKPNNKIHGVGVKVDPKIAATLPAEMDMDFTKLIALLRGEASK